MALSKASGPSSSAPVICLRSAILQSAAASMVEGIFEVTVSTADRMATRGVVPKPACVIEIDSVLDDIALAVEIREDIDRRVGYEDGLGVGRHVHDKDVADAPVGPQPADLGGDGAHDFVGMQAALHQDLALACVDQLHTPGGGRGLGWRRIDDFVAGDVQAVLGGDVPDPGRRADEDRPDDPCLRRLRRRRATSFRRRDAPRRLTRWAHPSRPDKPVVFDPGCVPLAAAGMALIGALRILAKGTSTPWHRIEKGNPSPHPRPDPS